MQRDFADATAMSEGSAAKTAQRFPRGERWATFDCYGTLIDWDAGIEGELERLFGPERSSRLLDRYHELEPAVQGASYRPYRDVLATVLEQLAGEEGLALPEAEEQALVCSLPGWQPFADAPVALNEARRRGWKLAILSNSDRDLIAASAERIGVPFDLIVVAEDVQSYKPGHAHWERFFAESGARRDGHVHVGASLFHDIVPANELGLLSVWINRLGECGSPEPTRELEDLEALPGTLDELVPR